MAAETTKTKYQPLSKGQRTHERRLKQNARKEGTVYHPNAVRKPLVKKSEE